MKPKYYSWLVFLGFCITTIHCSTPNTPKAQTSSDSTIIAQTPSDVNEPENRYWNDLARFLGGLVPESGSLTDSLDKLKAAQEHRAFFDQAWAEKKKALLDKLKDFSSRELSTAHTTTGNVFYPFSGADYITIQAIYPNASRYVFFGLEPEGNIPDSTRVMKADIGRNLANIRASANDILHLSFFKTNSMREDFIRYELNGTLPLFLAFIARGGNTVTNVRRIQIQADGTVADVADTLKLNPEDSIVSGFEVRYKDNEGKRRTLQYFSLNVHDSYLPKMKGFTQLVQSLKPTCTYVKSASYLMHKPYFSQIRDLVMDVSDVLLQDDSGIPIDKFDTSKWKLQYYGSYSRPIPLFANLYQPNLRKIYTTDTTIKPLEFGIGYNYQKGTSNLMLARKIQ